MIIERIRLAVPPTYRKVDQLMESHLPINGEESLEIDPDERRKQGAHSDGGHGSDERKGAEDSRSPASAIALPAQSPIPEGQKGHTIDVVV